MSKGTFPMQPVHGAGRTLASWVLGWLVRTARDCWQFSHATLPGLINSVAHQAILTQVDLNSCIALSALCAPGATWAEPAKVCGGHVPRVDTGVQSFPITSIPLPFHKGMAQFSSLLSALQTWGLSGAEILCTFASTELTGQTPDQTDSSPACQN